MRQEEKFNTQLDMELRDLAILEWSTFVKFVGEENIMAAKICLMRRKNSSYGLIQMKLGVSKMQARHISGKDECACNNKAK